MEANFEYSYDPSMGGASGAEMAMFGGVMIFAMIFAVAIYVYFAICLMKIAKKTNTPNAWLAWIPIANFYLMLMVAGRPWWWIFAFLAGFIPVIGPLLILVVSVIVWMDISEKLGKEKWLGILMIVPVANLILPGYLAFSGRGASAPAQPAAPAPKKKEPVDTGMDMD